MLAATSSRLRRLHLTKRRKRKSEGRSLLDITLGLFWHAPCLHLVKRRQTEWIGLSESIPQRSFHITAGWRRKETETFTRVIWDEMR